MVPPSACNLFLHDLPRAGEMIFLFLVRWFVVLFGCLFFGSSVGCCVLFAGFFQCCLTLRFALLLSVLLVGFHNRWQLPQGVRVTKKPSALTARARSCAMIPRRWASCQRRFLFLKSPLPTAQSFAEELPIEVRDAGALVRAARPREAACRKAAGPSEQLQGRERPRPPTRRASPEAMPARSGRPPRKSSEQLRRISLSRKRSAPVCRPAPGVVDQVVAAVQEKHAAWGALLEDVVVLQPEDLHPPGVARPRCRRSPRGGSRPFCGSAR